MTGVRHLHVPGALLLVALTVSLSLIAAPAGGVNRNSNGGERLVNNNGIDYWLDASGADALTSAQRVDVDWAFDHWAANDEQTGATHARRFEIGDAELLVRSGELTGPGSFAPARDAAGNRIPCSTMDRCTILVDDRAWHTGSSQPGQGESDFRTLALHEIGHAYGLGHSNGAQSYHGTHRSETAARDDIVMYPGLATGTSTRALDKDDCAGIVHARRGDVVCNFAMNDRWSHVSDTRPSTADSDDPAHFHGWNFGGGWEYQSCDGNCHWRARPYPETASGNYGLIYDVEGAGSARAGSQMLSSGSDWRTGVYVSAPSYNTEVVNFQVCMYLRDRLRTDAWNNTYRKPGAACSSSRTFTPGTSYRWVRTPDYTLPVHANDGEFLRTYVVVRGPGTLFVSQWEVEER